jgi:hypothetical protein
VGLKINPEWLLRMADKEAGGWWCRSHPGEEMNRTFLHVEELGSRALPAPLSFTYDELPTLDPIGVRVGQAVPVGQAAVVDFQNVWAGDLIKGKEGNRASGQLVLRLFVTVVPTGALGLPTGDPAVTYQITSNGFAPAGSGFNPTNYVGDWVTALSGQGFSAAATTTPANGLTIGRAFAKNGATGYVTNVQAVVVLATDESGTVLDDLGRFAPAVTNN